MAANESENNYEIFTTPRSRLLLPKIIPGKFNWNTPISNIRGTYELQQNIPFEFRKKLGKAVVNVPIKQVSVRQMNEDRLMFNQQQKFKEDLHLIKEVLEYYKEKGAKIILASSAVNLDTPKNVNQQFKFNRSPITPIILIDPAFLGNSPFEFYNYLQFDKGPEFNSKLSKIENSTVGSSSAVGPQYVHKVKIYRKPAGNDFLINEWYAGLTDEQKKDYMDEFTLQAKAAKVDLVNTAFEICTVAASADPYNFLGEWGKIAKELLDLVNSYKNARNEPVFHLYNFGDGYNEVLQLNRKKKLERSTLENLD